MEPALGQGKTTKVRWVKQKGKTSRRATYHVLRDFLVKTLPFPNHQLRKPQVRRPTGRRSMAPEPPAILGAPGPRVRCHLLGAGGVSIQVVHREEEGRLALEGKTHGLGRFCFGARGKAWESPENQKNHRQKLGLHIRKKRETK